MSARLTAAYGYQGDAMNLPVTDVDGCVPYYKKVMRFRVVAREDEPHRKVVLERDDVQMALAENGGDASQDGVAFHVEAVEELFDEFVANGWQPPSTRTGDQRFETEDHGDVSFKVLYVVAPDGLCFWFGEKQ